MTWKQQWGILKIYPKVHLGIDIEHNFKPDYVDVPKRAETIKDLICQKLKKQKLFILHPILTVKEKQLPSHVKEIIDGKGKVERITFHEITKEAVEEALQNPARY